MKNRVPQMVSVLLLAVVLTAAAAGCSSSSSKSACQGGDWAACNAGRKGYQPASTTTAKDVLAKLNAAGLNCQNVSDYSWGLIVKAYSGGKMPMALGAANCEIPRDAATNAGSDTEDVLVEVFGKRPNAQDFVVAKAKRICKRAEALNQNPNSAYKFTGIPFVMNAEKTWVVEPDNTSTARQIGKILGRPAQNMCDFD